MRKRITQRLIGFVLIGLLIVSSAAAFIWNESVQQAEPKVFYDAIRASLSSEGVTCEITKQENGNTSTQKIMLDLQSRTDAYSKTTLSQQGAKVVTEGIATKDDDYVRYTQIQAPGKDARGNAFDFSKVINVWGKQSRQELGGSSLYDQAALGGCVVPLADLPADKAKTLMAEIEKGEIFKTDFNKVRRAGFEGRPVYEYPVTLTGPVYIQFMKKVAQAQGMDSLKNVDEESYAQRLPEELIFTINRSSHRLERIQYDGNTQTITLSGYGKRPPNALPKSTVSTVELQNRLQAAR